MTMHVEERRDGWWVLDDGQERAGPFRTSSEAWRWVDRNEVHPLGMTKAEADKAGAYGIRENSS